MKSIILLNKSNKILFLLVIASILNIFLGFYSSNFNLIYDLLFTILIIYISIFDCFNKELPMYSIISGLIISLNKLLFEFIFLEIKYPNILLINIFFAFIIFTICLAINIIGESFTEKNILGKGDAKFIFLCSLWFEKSIILNGLSYAFISASIYTIISMLRGNYYKYKSFAFTPFISFGIFLKLII